MKLIDLVRSRHSVRSYESRPVEQEKLDYILECTRMAPSAVNFQPWQFVVITDKQYLEKIKAAYNRDWIQSAPCIVVACANHDESWHRRSDNKDHADIDVAIAVEHLCLAATEVGLGSCWVCNFDPVLCSEALSLPANVEPVVMIPLGYASEESVADKKRKAQDEIILYI